MKTNYLIKILVYLIFIVNTISWSQTNNHFSDCSEINKDTLIISECYNNLYTKPLQINEGQFIINHSDTIFLVNKLRMNFYEKLREILNYDLESKNLDVIKNYEVLLNECNKQYNSLLHNCDSLSNNYQQLITQADYKIYEISQSLNESKISISESDKSLNEAKKILKKEKDNRLIRNLTYGLGGVGLGILIGILVQ